MARLSSHCQMKVEQGYWTAIWRQRQKIYKKNYYLQIYKKYSLCFISSLCSSKGLLSLQLERTVPCSSTPGTKTKRFTTGTKRKRFTTGTKKRWGLTTRTKKMRNETVREPHCGEKKIKLSTSSFSALKSCCAECIIRFVFLSLSSLSMDCRSFTSKRSRWRELVRCKFSMSDVIRRAWNKEVNKAG